MDGPLTHRGHAAAHRAHPARDRVVARRAKHEDVSFADFSTLIKQPHAQPTLARLIDRLFGYSLSGSHAHTEVTSATGQVIALAALYDMIQSDGGAKAGLRKSVHSLYQ